MCPQNSDTDRVQFRFQSLERCIIKHFEKNTKLYSIEFLRTEMTSDPSELSQGILT